VNYLIRKGVKSTVESGVEKIAGDKLLDENGNKRQMGPKTAITMIIIGGSLLFGVIIYHYYCQKIPSLNETQQGLLYDTLKKKSYSNDVFDNIKKLGDSKDEKQVKLFVNIIFKKSNYSNIFVNEFKKFTNNQFNLFNELVNIKNDKIKTIVNDHIKEYGTILINNLQSILDAGNYSKLQSLCNQNENLCQILINYLKI